MTPLFTATDFFVLKPTILLCLFGCGILLTDLLIRDPRLRYVHVITVLVGELFTGAAIWMLHDELAAGGFVEFSALSGALVVDGFGIFFSCIFLVSAVLAAVISSRYLDDQGDHRGEYYALMLFAQAGMMMMAMGTELVTLFLGLELMALCFYVMVGFLRGQKRANEAAMKYLLLGAFSSGLLAYGFSILYGIGGSTYLSDIAEEVSRRGAGDPLVLLAMITTSVGLFFKISAVPFHMWAPDVYEGAPTPIAAYVSVASKAASFALMMRIFLGPFAGVQEVLTPMLAVVALASLTLGNLAAITQTNLKRLLAYSSIAHAGYMLLGLVAANETGLRGISVYLLVYMFMNFGVFALIATLRREGEAAEDIDDLSGLMQRHPGYAILMLIFLLSLAGIPPTAGFLGKYFIFLALLESGHYLLAVVGALYVAVATYYYFRIVRVMFVPEGGEPAKISMGRGTKLALAASGIFTVGIGLYPEPFIGFATNSILPALR